MPVAGDSSVDGSDPLVDWAAMAAIGGTIVIHMGSRQWSPIAEGLLAGGLASDTPVIAVWSGVEHENQKVQSTLSDLSEDDIEFGSTLIIGESAAISLGSFDDRPLFAKQVVVTRATEQAPELAQSLRRRGATPLMVPAIEILEPSDGGVAMDGAIAGIASFDWIVFTSPNGASRFCTALPDSRALGGVRVAAIGPGTASALAAFNVVPDLLPDSYVAEGLLEAFPPPPSNGGHVVLARAEQARDVLPIGLRAMGWTVDVVTTYRTVAAQIADQHRALVAEADIVTFTSSSTVRNFVQQVNVSAVPPLVASIGPITSATAREAGLSVDVEADEHTIAGLVRALEDHLRRG